MIVKLNVEQQKLVESKAMGAAELFLNHQSWLVKGCSFKTIGYDMTGKAIAILDSQFNLMSENPKYEPIHIEEIDFKVMGKLIGIIKRL